MRLSRAAAIAAVLLPLVAAAPNTAATPPEGIDFEMVVATDVPAEIHGEEATGAVNVWTHFSTWDANTCNSASPENRCDKVLIWFDDAGEATVSLTAAYAVADYDLIVYESGRSGDPFNVVGHNASSVTPVPGEGPVPVPGDESVTFEADAEAYYLAVVFYRSAGGGYSLVGELA